MFLSVCTETRLEGWLSLPVRNNTKRFGWERKVSHLSFARFRYPLYQNIIRIEPMLLCLCFVQYVVVSSKKILFYNSEQDKELSNPYMVLDIE